MSKKNSVVKYTVYYETVPTESYGCWFKRLSDSRIGWHTNPPAAEATEVTFDSKSADTGCVLSTVQ